MLLKKEEVRTPGKRRILINIPIADNSMKQEMKCKGILKYN